MAEDTLPAILLLPHEEKRLQRGHPWVFSNEIRMDAPAKALPRGTLVRLLRSDGKALGLAHFNPHTLIAARLLARESAIPVDAAFFRRRIERAAALRQRLHDKPFYRLVHGEADLLPGLIIDRYGDVLVLEPNTAGMELMLPDILAALEGSLAPRAILVQRSSPARALEGLPRSEPSLALGALEGPLEVLENGFAYRADLFAGQKTGWFFDQRENRAFMARLARGARVLDAYCYAGGFALLASAGGAAEVLALDRSDAALALAGSAAEAAGLSGVRFLEGEAFATLEGLAGERARFEVVIADPPAFAKSRKDVKPALSGYRKLARLTAWLTAPGGVMFLASCSYHIDRESFLAAAARGIADAGRSAQILRYAGAGPDHPVLPALPEQDYLKALALRLD